MSNLLLEFMRRTLATDLELQDDKELQDDEWERPEPVDLEGVTVLEVFESAPPTYWTTDLPTHAGLWLCRVPPDGDPRVVEVFWHRTDHLHIQGLQFGWTDVPQTSLESVRGKLEWDERCIRLPREPRERPR